MIYLSKSFFCLFALIFSFDMSASCFMPAAASKSHQRLRSLSELMESAQNLSLKVDKSKAVYYERRNPRGYTLQDQNYNELRDRILTSEGLTEVDSSRLKMMEQLYTLLLDANENNQLFDYNEFNRGNVAFKTKNYNKIITQQALLDLIIVDFLYYFSGARVEMGKLQKENFVKLLGYECVTSFLKRDVFVSNESRKLLRNIGQLVKRDQKAGNPLFSILHILLEVYIQGDQKQRFEAAVEWLHGGKSMTVGLKTQFYIDFINDYRTSIYKEVLPSLFNHFSRDFSQAIAALEARVGYQGVKILMNRFTTADNKTRYYDDIVFKRLSRLEPSKSGATFEVKDLGITFYILERANSQIEQFIKNAGIVMPRFDHAVTIIQLFGYDFLNEQEHLKNLLELAVRYADTHNFKTRIKLVRKMWDVDNSNYEALKHHLARATDQRYGNPARLHPNVFLDIVFDFLDSSSGSSSSSTNTSCSTSNTCNSSDSGESSHSLEASSSGPLDEYF